jgi:parallel beta-helix repeat protein
MTLLPCFAMGQASPSPGQVPGTMREPMVDPVRVRVGHADAKPSDGVTAAGYDLLGRDNLVIQAAIDYAAALDADPAGFGVGHGVAIWDDAVKHFHVTVARITGRSGSTIAIDLPLRGDCLVKRAATASTVFPVVSGCDIEAACIADLEIDGSRDKNPLLDGCRGGGIYLCRSHGTTIRGCTVRRYSGDGVSYQQSNDVTVVDTVCIDNAGHGFHPGSGSQRTVMRGCRSERNGEDGMFVCWRVKHGTFEDNVFVGNARNGISIGHKDTDNLLRSNVVRENASDGILFREELPGMGGDRNRIESNTIEDNGGAGIRIRGPTSDNRLIGNIIRESRQGEGRRQTIGVAIEAASGDNQLERNRIDADEPVRDDRPADPAPLPTGRR